MDPIDVARHLHTRDASAAAFGIELVDAAPDGATVRMLVRPDMCNGFEIIHGGMAFLLADSAMAFASNSENEMALATTAEIDWLQPVSVGAILTATARRRWAGARSAMWDVSLTIGDDPATEVGVFRGRTRKIGRSIVD